MRRIVPIVLALLLTTPLLAAAQEKFPSRPIDFVVTWGAGGGADAMARQLGSLSQPLLGVALPASNVPGASGNTGLAQVLSGKPDGYTIATYIQDTLMTLPMGLARYKVDDLEWITRTQVADSFLLVRAESPFRTIQELFKHAQANPGKLRVASTGFGTVDDVTVRFLDRRGYKMITVPYPKPGERYAAALGGHTEVLYEQAGDVLQYLKAGPASPADHLRGAPPSRLPGRAQLEGAGARHHAAAVPRGGGEEGDAARARAGARPTRSSKAMETPGVEEVRRGVVLPAGLLPGPRRLHPLGAGRGDHAGAAGEGVRDPTVAWTGRARVVALVAGVAVPACCSLSTAPLDAMVAPGQLGPGFWPRLVLIGFAVACGLRSCAEPDRGERRAPAAPALLRRPPRPRHRLPAGLRGRGAAGRIPARHRRRSSSRSWCWRARGGRRASWPPRVVGTAVLLYTFVKVVYLPFPKGDGPFERVTLALYRALGIF